MRSNVRGVSLVSVVVALAVFAVLAALVGTLYQQMTNLRLRAEVEHDAATLTRYVQEIMNNTPLCNRALRTGFVTGGGEVPWNIGANPPAPLADVGHIEVNDTVNPRVMIVSASGTSSRVSNLLSVNRIYLREPLADEGAPARSRIVLNDDEFDVVQAKLVIQFAAPALFRIMNPATGASGLRPGVVDVALAVRRTGARTVAFCYSTAPSQATGQVCQAPLPGCPAAVPQCTVAYFMRGFDADGKPLCDCELVCQPSAPSTGPTTPTSSMGKGSAGGPTGGGVTGAGAAIVVPAN